jgi:hypothetical protein
MPARRYYNIFISHAWQYDEAFHRLLAMLNAAPYFSFANFSVPEPDPLQAETALGLVRALYRQMWPTHVVLMLAGMYAHHREWMLKEIEIAQQLQKPIIGIVSRDQERAPKAIQDAAKELVNWNTVSIVGAIRRRAL